MWEKLLGVWRDFGLLAGTLYLADRLLRATSRRAGLCVYELMYQPIDGKDMLPGRLAANIGFREIGPGDPDVQRMPAREEIKAARFAGAARCLGVLRKDVLLGYVWLSFSDYEEDEVRCTYCLPGGGGNPASVFDFDLFVFPEHRMGIGFLAIWHATNRYLHQRGVSGSFSRMTRFNLASRRAHVRLGSRVVGRALFVQCGPVEVMLADLRPYLALTWRPAQRVRLQLPRPGNAET